MEAFNKCINTAASLQSKDNNHFLIIYCHSRFFILQLLFGFFFLSLLLYWPKFFCFFLSWELKKSEKSRVRVFLFTLFKFIMNFFLVRVGLSQSSCREWVVIGLGVVLSLCVFISSKWLKEKKTSIKHICFYFFFINMDTRQIICFNTK